MSAEAEVGVVLKELTEFRVETAGTLGRIEATLAAQDRTLTDHTQQDAIRFEEIHEDLAALKKSGHDMDKAQAVAQAEGAKAGRRWSVGVAGVVVAVLEAVRWVAENLSLR